MTTPQYPGYPGDGSRSGYNPQDGGGSAYGPPPGYGPHPGMGVGGGVPPYPRGAMGGVPMSVGDGLSWAWSKFKDNVPILIVGIGLWTILSNFGIDTRIELNGHEYGYGLGIPFGNHISFIVRLFAGLVITNMSLKVATGRPLDWNDLFAFPNFGASLLAGLLTAIAMAAGLVLCIVPGIVVAFLLSYSVYFTVDKGVDGIEGMKASWRILSSHVGELLPFALTGVGLYLLGGITIIGWIVTIPLVFLMTAYSYVRIQGYDVVR